MKKLFLSLVMMTAIVSITFSQTRQASHSAAFKTGSVKIIDLINGLKIEVDFNPDKETLWFRGESNDLKMFITESIPLSDPNGSGIEIGKSYRLNNMYATIEYKVLKIEGNKVTRIWFRVAARTLELPEKNWI
ncbi:MAG: hypothetical protein U9N72_05185 [Bacteroidota bacterium]|nr:hypothetical protein [Bacteroidota bacterium]